MAKKPCAAQILADAAGLSIEEICRQAGQRKGGMSRSHFMRLCRNGGANYSVAKRLARICRCNMLVFCWGYEKWLHYSQPRSRNSLSFRAFVDTESVAGPEAILAEPNR